MTTTAYDVGDLKRCSCAFTSIAGAATDPTAVVLVIREPDGTEITKSYPTPSDITKDSTGNYHYDFAITKAGRHVERWVGTGAVAVGEKIEFWARAKGVSA